MTMSMWNSIPFAARPLTRGQAVAALVRMDSAACKSLRRLPREHCPRRARPPGKRRALRPREAAAAVGSWLARATPGRAAEEAVGSLAAFRSQGIWL